MADNFYNLYWEKRGKSKGIRLRYKIFLNWLEPNSTILDLGGGDGHLAEILQQEKGCRVTVMDLSAKAVAIAKERGVEALSGNIEEQLPFADNAFDVVILSEVLEHIIHSEDVLKEASRVSKKTILISVPNTGFYKYRLNLLLGHFPKQWAYFPWEHLRFWTDKDFKNLIKNFDLTIDQVKASAGRRFLRDLYPPLLAEQLCFKLIKN